MTRTRLRLAYREASMSLWTKCWLLLVSMIVAFSLSISAQGVGTWLSSGSRGPDVVLIQDWLTRLGYLSGRVDGIFGIETLAAVYRFQKEHGIAADGIVGPATWRSMQQQLTSQSMGITVRKGDTLWDLARKHQVSVNELAQTNGVTQPEKLRVGQKLVLPNAQVEARPELVLWHTADELFPHGAIAKVTDIESGLTFRVRRYYGSYHADVEPLTRQDTETIRELYGGEFSWSRRAIVVKVKGRCLAASMNGFPHGSSSIHDNGFPGHFCIHFLGSRLHLDGTMHRSHQEMVLRAAGYPKSPLWFAGDRTP